MKSFCCGKGLAVFTLTFGIGICFALIGYQGAPTFKVKKEALFQPPLKNKLNEIPKFKCDALKMKIFKLFIERCDLEEKIKTGKSDTFQNILEEKPISEKEVKEINKQITKLEKQIKEDWLKPLDSERYMTLWIQNCTIK